MNNLLSLRTLSLLGQQFKSRKNTILKHSLTSLCQFLPLRFYKPSLSLGHVSRPDENNIITFLTKHLNCSLIDAELLYNNHNKFLIDNHTNLTDAINILDQNGFSKHTIVEHFWILIYQKGIVI